MRFLVRFIGVFVFAAAFVMFVIDGTRSIAGNAIYVSSLAEGIGLLWPDAVANIEAGLRSVSDTLWDPAARWIFEQPAFAVLGLIGLLLLFVGRKRREVVRPLRRRY
jgi:MYXO-CTERM domain-containing protein